MLLENKVRDTENLEVAHKKVVRFLSKAQIEYVSKTKRRIWVYSGNEVPNFYNIFNNK